ncbi:MAG: GAF and ANTAR domain-containing protein [Acidimicrobiales bacterium]|nr:GAF and ANTAR domain-containing protein [Acidimicrobiales bacterium]HRW39195.1 GAF and ANTAR domain-containing protein [Aquihabitans sp.]
MVERDRTNAVLHEYYVGDATLDEALSVVCDAAIDEVGPAVMAGISMTVDGRIGTYIFTHPEVEEVDRPQYDTGDGPCVQAFRTGRTVVVESTVQPTRFPAFAATAVAHGLLSVVSLPMIAGGDVVGALNLYATTERAFSPPLVVVGERFASQAAYLLANVRAYWDSRLLSENLAQAMASRAAIEQAKGIIVSATGVTPEEAFERLVEQSQHENVKVRDLAGQIVRRAVRSRLEPGGDAPPGSPTDDLQ